MRREKAVNFILGATIALLPLYNRVTTQDFTRTSKDNLLLIIFAVLTFLLPDKKRSIPKLFWTAFIYCILNLIFNQWLVLSIMVMFQSFYVAIGLVFFVSFYEKHCKESLGAINNGMFFGCLVQSLIGIGQYFNYDIYPMIYSFIYPGAKLENSSAVVGTLGNINLLGSYIALTSLSMLEKERRIFLIIPFTALLLAGSVMPIATFASGLIYFFGGDLFKKWFLYVGAACSMFLFYIFGGPLKLDSGRFDTWRELLGNVSLKHFLIGQGPGWFADKHFEIKHQGEAGNEHYLLLQEHNSFLTAFNFFGVIIFILLLPEFIKFLKREDKNKIFASILFAAFVNSYGHFTLHQSTVAIIIVVCACVCISEGESINVSSMDR